MVRPEEGAVTTGAGADALRGHTGSRLARGVCCRQSGGPWADAGTAVGAIELRSSPVRNCLPVPGFVLALAA